MTLRLLMNMKWRLNMKSVSIKFVLNSARNYTFLFSVLTQRNIFFAYKFILKKKILSNESNQLFSRNASKTKVMCAQREIEKKANNTEL